MPVEIISLTPGADAAPFTGLTFPNYTSILIEPDQPKVTGIVLAARDAGETVGLLVGAMPKPGVPNPPTLFSLYVLPARRNQGIGTALMEAFHAEVRRRGGSLIRVIYMHGKESADWFERIMAKTGWDEPVPRMIAVKCEIKMLRASDPPWMRRRRLTSEKFSIIDWKDVTQEMKDELRRSHEEEKWIAPDLVPWLHEKDFDPGTSCGLLENGKLVSWVINHHMADGTTRFTCSFAHPRLQKRGVVTWLYARAADQMEVHDRTYCMWTVPLTHPGMYAMAVRWMKPVSVSCRETFGCEKKLT